jgi:signal transduction histidine kinase
MPMNFEKLKQQQEEAVIYFPKDYKPIDMLYKQTLYGKLNLDGRPIVPTISSIVPVSTPSSRNSNATALNIMSLAFGDLNMIKSVWSNLIENAIKFTKKKEKKIIFS